MSDKFPKYGTLDGKQVELTDEFIQLTSARDLQNVRVQVNGRELRPFKSCREPVESQIGSWPGLTAPTS